MTQILENAIAEIDELNNKIFELNSTIAPALATLNGKKQELQSQMDEEISKIAARELASKQYGCGTANLETSMHKIKVVVSKKIKWDEKQLKNISEQIRTSGQDPEVYIKYKLSVSETAYKGFPENIQAVFEPAREVMPNKPKITIERK